MQRNSPTKRSEDKLAGVLPKHGLSTMLAARDGRMFRVTFELVNCSLQTTFDRLHPML